jgi:hypothetical protein
MKRLVCGLLSVSVIALSTPALAQSTGSAEAEELFKQGRAALEAKDYAAACSRLAESNRLERAVGTLISLAQCEEAQNKLAAARQHWQEAADFADALHDRLNRGPAARQKFTELDKRVPRLTVKRTPNAPPGTTVKRDEVELTFGSFGSALPVDSGKHVLVVSALQHESRSFEITLAEGESKEVEVEPGAETSEPLPTPLASVGRDTRNGSMLRVAGYVVGGAGIVGIGLGAVFGLQAASKWSSAQDGCKPGACGAGSQARGDQDTASRSGTISTITFVIGGAALATGIALVLLAPSSSTSAPTAATVRLTPGLGGFSAVGEF